MYTHAALGLLNLARDHVAVAVFEPAGENLYRIVGPGPAGSGPAGSGPAEVLLLAMGAR